MQSQSHARKGAVRTVASLVATADEDQPFLRGLGVVLDGLVQSVLPVVERQLGDGQRADLGLGSTDGVLDDGLGDVGAELVEQVLELGLVLGEASLLGGSEDGETCEKNGEAHYDYDYEYEYVRVKKNCRWATISRR